MGGGGLEKETESAVGRSFRNGARARWDTDWFEGLRRKAMIGKGVLDGMMRWLGVGEES